jgi:hypothetical protein
MTSQYRLVAGTLTAAALTADSGSIVANWTTTLTSGGWIVASNHLVTPYVERVAGLDGSYGTVGRPHHIWRIARMDDAMFTTLCTELPNESTLVTMRTYNRLKSGGVGWVTYNCRAVRPAFLSEELHPKQGNFFVDVPIRFILMSVAAVS